MSLTDRRSPGPWTLVGVAALILMVTMGLRQSLGLFVSPLNTATGLGLATISFAMAVSQLTWGAVQPFAGALADRFGARTVLVGGMLLLALGAALTPVAGSAATLTLTLGLMIAAGAGICSFSVLMGAVAQHVPAERRGPASGLINAGSSFGQFVFAPLSQALIVAFEGVRALWALAAVALLALPLVRWVPARTVHPPAGGDPGPASLAGAVRRALADRSYQLLIAGFFTCGFHIAFLVTHLPGEVQLCGMPTEVASWSLGIIGLANIVGSLLAGWWVNRTSGKYILFWMYFSRAVMVLAYLAAPKTPLTFYVFAAGLGLTWLATVPPTASIVTKLYGARFMGTLFGIALFSHQVGGFLGAWLGGIAFVQTGSFAWMWWADAALALAAALVNLPIREPAPPPRVVIA